MKEHIFVIGQAVIGYAYIGPYLKAADKNITSPVYFFDKPRTLTRKISTKKRLGRLR